MSTLSFQPDAARFYEQGYWRAGDLWQEFAGCAAATPDKIALHAGDVHLSFRGLERAAVALSARLADRGVQPGDVVLALGRHSIEAAVAMLACFHRGAVLAPLPPMFNAAQLSALAAQTGAKSLLTFGGEREIAKCESVAEEFAFVLALRAEDLDELIAHDAPTDREAAGADDVAFVLHSSGTTSLPKGIAHSANTLRYATEHIMKRWQLTSSDVNLVACEFGFVGGLVFGYFPTLLKGATGVLMTRWNAHDALALIETHRCAYALFMPTHGADLLEAAEKSENDWSSVRALAIPGLTRERREAVCEVFGQPPLADYGLSEVPGHAAHGLIEAREKVLTTEGLPYEGTEIRILDSDDAPLPSGQIGGVVVNGPSRFLGFLGNDALTRESLTEWGGYRTGDVGALDADGHLLFVGRSKDIIRRGGVTIVPAEIEPVILRHPAVHEVAVVPLPDERLGERACAAVIAAPGRPAPTLEELQEFLALEGVAKYTWPERVEAFEDFPRTPSLKPIKREIVAAIRDRAATPVA
jgi:acyl-CoA synthetase (AMP-forming)/AMP-acid ligase II